MPISRGAAPQRVSGGRWLVHRYSVADGVVAPIDSGSIDPARAEQAGSANAGMWRLMQARREPPLATSDITTVLEATIDLLRRLDDSEGGSAAAVGFVQDQLDTITTYLTRGRTTSPAVRRRLIRASAQLHQLAGWMAFDSERHATAERYFRAGLRAARDIDDTDLTAYILACMACHLAYCGHFSEAMQIADAAIDAARDAHPAVRSIAASRSGYTRATAADRKGFHVAADRAQQMWATAGEAGPKPDFLYWYGQNYLNIQRSESMQLLAFAMPYGGADILREADELLDDRIRQNAASMPRDVALHSAWLARAHVKLGEIDRAVSITELVITQLQSVRSPRVRKVLRSVKADLAQCRVARREPRVQQLCQRIRRLTE